NETNETNETSQKPGNVSENERNNSQINDTNQTGYIRGLAKVDNINLTTAQGMDQLIIEVSGHLPDSCTEIEEITTTRNGKELTVNITTKRPEDATCSQVIEHFEKDIKFNIDGLDESTYNVCVNGVNKSIAFD
ncbi:MAG: hypothetical protein ACLFMM_05265, partial [Methanohalobium sp.]